LPFQFQKKKKCRYKLYKFENQENTNIIMAKRKATEELTTPEIKTDTTGSTEIIIERQEVETAEEIQEELSIAQKLLSLYYLQQICSQIDKIRFERGELPNEVRDLEDSLEGMNTRIAKHQEEIKVITEKIASENNKAKESQVLIKRYEEQQNNVRNNREYETLSKEIEYQTLEIQIAEKHISKLQAESESKTAEISSYEEKSTEISDILNLKKSELDVIIAETEAEESALLEKAEVYKAKIEPRLLSAFERIRQNARNGLAIVQIERDACGGCHSLIPPQRQLDIRLHKKIIVCEACGRIFIDKQLVEEQQNNPDPTQN
jgi:uncharacterized protein